MLVLEMENRFLKSKWVDDDDGLYRKKDVGYDFEEYAKEVAQLEYDKNDKY